jgi:hypothetical protein
MNMHKSIVVAGPSMIETLATPPVEGTIVGVGGVKVTFVPFAEELLPTTGTEMLNLEQTSPNSVVKAICVSSSSALFPRHRSLLLDAPRKFSRMDETYCTYPRWDCHIARSRKA